MNYSVTVQVTSGLQSLAGNTLTAGHQVSFAAYVNGIEIPAGNFVEANWKVIGNVRLYETVSYLPQRGFTDDAVLTSYPLILNALYATPARPSVLLVVELSGSVLVPPIPKFEATNTFNVVPPGLASSWGLTKYGNEVVYAEIDQIKTIIMYHEGQGYGVEIEFPFRSFPATVGGTIFNLNLINGYAHVDGPTGAFSFLDTHGLYWYDGSAYPYDEPVPLKPSQQTTLVFVDFPQVHPERSEIDTIDYNCQFRTYSFFQSNAPNSVPVLLRYPVKWGWSWQARWDHTEKTYIIENPNFTPFGEFKDMTMPTWYHHAPGSKDRHVLASTLNGSSNGGDGKTETIIKASSPIDKHTTGIQGPEQAARSCRVIFENYSNAYLGRVHAYLEHGIWSDEFLPPEEIGPGTSHSSTNALWAAESQGFWTGTEGNVVYMMEDGETTIKVYWAVPYFKHDNTYSVNIEGPLSGAYEGTFSVEGSNKNTRMIVNLRNK